MSNPGGIGIVIALLTLIWRGRNLEVNKMVEQVREQTIGSATEKMKEGAQEFKEALASSARGTLEQYRDDATHLIQDNPYRSVLIAFGVGALFGMLMLRRG